MTQTTDLKAITDALRQHDRFLVVTHENPDGDALGSLLAATLALRQLGKDVVMYHAGGTPLRPPRRGEGGVDIPGGGGPPRPAASASTPPGGPAGGGPADASERVLLAVDCAKEDRIGDEAVLALASLVLDVDHHHDNTRF